MPAYDDARLADFEFGAALIDVAKMGVFIEIWFYTTHRALHWPPLFKVRRNAAARAVRCSLELMR